MAEVKTSTFDVLCEMEANGVGKMRCEVGGDMIVGDKAAPDYQFSFAMASDEGKFHGGDNTGPPPLAFFCTGLISCLMTQIRAFSRRLKVPIGDVRIVGRILWRAEQAGRDPYVARPVSFELDVDLDSPAPIEDQRKLIHAARKGCFVEASLEVPVPIAHRVKSNGDWLLA